MSELNEKQARFVEEYLVDLNATQAAIRAGYSRRTAAEQGYDLLRKPQISEAVQAGQVRLSKATGVSAQVILGELLRIARVDIGEAFDENGALKPLKEIPEDVRRAISGMEVDELFDGTGRERLRIGETRKVKFWDKTRALELLAKHLGLLKDRVELTGKDGGPVTVENLSPDEARKLVLERLGKAAL